MVKKQKITWQQYIAVAIAVIAVLFFGGWYFFNQVYLKPENVFWSMLDRNLKTGSITKTYQESSDTGSYELVTKLQLKGQLASQTAVTIKDVDSTYVTDTIGTPTQDYLRYSQISSAVAPATQNGINVWAVNAASDTQPAQVFLNELLSSPMIFGYLNHNQRTDIIKQMRNNSVFDVDFSSVNTTATVGNKKVYSYDVTINLAGYLPIYQTYLRAMGQNDIADQIGSAAPGSTLSVKLFVEPASRHLLQLTMNSNDQTVTFSNFDTTATIELPKDANLSIEELQALISEQ